MLVTLLLAAAAPAGASAQVPLADGDRWVAWDDASAQRTTVRDDARGTTRRVERPAGCSSVLIGGGSLLWSCRGDDVVLDLTSGARRAVLKDEEPPPGADGEYGYERIGKRWVERSYYQYRVDGTLHYIDLLTGERREGPSNERAEAGEAAPSPREVIDLDDADLARPLCAPLRRRVQTSFEVMPTYADYRFDGRMGVEVTDTLRLQRCGSRERRGLRADCQGTCQISFGARRVVFVRRYPDRDRPGLLGVYDDRTRRVRCLRTSAPLGDGFGHTRRRLWLARPGGGVRPVAFPRRRC